MEAAPFGAAFFFVVLLQAGIGLHVACRLSPFDDANASNGTKLLFAKRFRREKELMNPRLLALLALGAMVLPAASASLAGQCEPHSIGQPTMRTRPDANLIGIWKSFVPGSLKGEFDSHDPVGLMAGTLIKADCSLNWRDPDTGKLYCFASGTSLVYFQDWPKSNIRKAAEAYGRLVNPKAGS